MEIRFPVIDPVNVFRDAFCYASFPQMDEFPQRCKLLPDFMQKLFGIRIGFKIKTDKTYAVVRLCIWQKINKHIRLVCFCQRDFVFDFHSARPKFRQHGADIVFGFCRCLYGIFFPLHFASPA